ncbi:MAG: hypothetical protein IKG82_04665, partial [Oscillospiraceae bacterium]|nr:hypothetical protein [Oscillospiraceae bacterium]
NRPRRLCAPFRGGLGKASALGEVTPQKPQSAACTWQIGGASPTVSGGNRPRRLCAPFRGGLGKASALGEVTPQKPRSAACKEENRERPAAGSRRKTAPGTAGFGQKNGKFPRESAVPKSFSKKICDFAKKHLLFFVKYAKIGMYEKSARIASVLRVHALFS